MSGAVFEGGLARKRVVLMVAGAVLGGAERIALELARALLLDGRMQVSLCSLDGGSGRTRDESTGLGLPWIVVPGAWHGSRVARVRMLGRVALELRRLRPDVIVSFTNLPNVICGLTWRATGAKRMVWNQCDVLGTTRFGSRTFRHALHSAPLVVTTAFQARDWLVREWDVNPGRLHVLRSLVELPPARDSRESWRMQLDLREGEVVACMLANLHAGKDHATLLHAWRSVVDELEREGRSATLLLAGRDAGGEAAAKALAYDLDLRRQVRFLGEVDDVSGVLGASDLAVFLSHSECLGRGATEPMYAGLAVVGSDVPGIREAVGAPGAELLVPPRDESGVAGALLRLIREPGYRNCVGRANAELIRSRHAEQRTTQRYAALLAGAVD